MATLVQLELTKKIKRKKLLRNVIGWLYISPVVLGILIFTFFPVMYAFISSFFDYQLGQGLFEFGKFTLHNYQKPFTPDVWPLFSKAVSVTVLYALINIPLTLVLSFAIALLLNQKLKGMKFFRLLFYLPVLIPAVCSGILWKNFTSVDFGFANVVLESMGLPPFKWFSSAQTSMPSLIIVGLFGLGGGMILWLAQLKNVPQSYYESAKLDGASSLRQLFFITIPMCSPMIFYNIIMSVIATLQTFASVYTITGGPGESYSLLFYVIYIYNTAFDSFNMGYAASLSFILFLVIGIITIITFKTNKWVYYGEEA